MYDIVNVADAILKIAKAKGQRLTPMQLVKLCYIAHGWSLALQGKPLFHNRIEAWQYGPVIPDLYHITKPWGREPIALDAIAGEGTGGLSPQDFHFLQQVFERYGHFDGIQLSSLTHKPGTPWIRIYNGRQQFRNNQIPDWLIQQYYLGLAHAAKP